MEEQAKSRAMNAFFTSDVPQQREYDANGNLRITLRFMRTGLLKYAPIPDTFPNGVPPDAIGPDGMVTVYVDPEDLGDAESLRSLSGLDGLRKHEWVTPDTPRDAVASVAGMPQFDGTFVCGEALVKDRETIRLLELPDGDPDKLVEVSAGYGPDMDWTPGKADGQRYAGKQKGIMYNHFVFLRKGEGRAGSNCRVTNSKETKVSEVNNDGMTPVYSRKLQRVVWAMNAKGAEDIAEADAKEEAKAENESGDGNEPQRAAAEEAKLPTAEDVAGMKAQLAAMTAKIEELTAQRDELLAAASGDAVEAAADGMAAEREEAAEVMAANGMDKAQALNSFKEKKLRGTELKVFAMNSIREAGGRQPLTEEQAKSPDAVNGMWSVTKEFSGQKRHVAGAVSMGGKAMNTADYQRNVKRGLGFVEKENK